MGAPGCPVTQETRDKISASKKGKKIADRGPEWREKMRLVHLGKKKSPEAVINMSLCQRGKKHTRETRLKMSATRREKYRWVPGLNCPPYKDRRVTRAKQIMPLEDSKIEKWLQSQLDSLGIEYVKHYEVKGTRKLDVYHRYDIGFPERKTVVEMNGCYWHACSKCFPQPNPSQLETKTRDAFIAEVTLRLGWRLIVIWEHQVPHFTADDVRRLLL